MVVKNRKGKGSRAELEAMHYLEQMGYSVTKAGGSLGAWDLIALPHRELRGAFLSTNSKEAIAQKGVSRSLIINLSYFQPLCIQVKTNHKPCGKELDEYDEAAYLISDCVCLIWLRKDGKGRKPATWHEAILPAGRRYSMREFKLELP